MLYLIGLGLGDVKDVTIKGLEIIKKCDRVYLESYTSILSVGAETLTDFYGRSIIVADREMVEERAEELLENCKTEDIAFLVIGDPFGATTHTDLILRARAGGYKVQVIHNASIMNAVGCCGLQLYSFGETISIPYWTEAWQPDSYYDKIVENRVRGLHTLCLLDINVKEPTLFSLCKKKREYGPPKFMSAAEAAEQLIQIIERRKKIRADVSFSEESLTVGLARVASDHQRIVACSLKEMTNTCLGPPLHCLVVPAEKLHFAEYKYLITYASNPEEFAKMAKQ